MLASRVRRPPAWEGVRVFGYHRVTDDDNDVFAVAPSAFREHMALLVRSGVRVVTLEEATEILSTRVEGRYACLTFDDGYLDNLEHAVPVLEQFELPATIFAISEVLEGRATFGWYRIPPPALTTAELPRLLESGLVSVQSHSRTHPRLTLVPEEQLAAELEESKAALERLVGSPVTCFSYPAGIYGPREAEAVAAAGYRAGFTTRPGVNRGGGPLFELRRTMIYWRDDAVDFAAKLAGALDREPWLAARVREGRARPLSVRDRRRADAARGRGPRSTGGAGRSNA